MSTYTTESSATTADDRTDERTYPAERAYGPRHDTPAWRRVKPDLSGGSIEIHRACDAQDGYSHEDVTSS